MVGTYQNQRCTLDSIRRLDYGDKHFYAPQTLIEPGGRMLMWGWIQEGRHAQRDAGWSGVMLLPRVVTMNDDVLCLAPAPELAALRREHTHLTDVQLAPDGELLLDVQGDALELQLDVELDADTIFGLVVRRAHDGAEQTVIGYDAAAQRLFVDRQRSSGDAQADRDVQAGALALHPSEPLRLRVFLDRSVIEVFANARACLTSRVYPTRPNSLGLALTTQGGAARVREVHIWRMASVEHFAAVATG